MDAVIFDMDGVVTNTARIHAQAWKGVFDRFLHDSTAHHGVAFAPFTDVDYLDLVDGKPRYDGVASFLSSRGIPLPDGVPSDPPGFGTICAVGNLKDSAFEGVIERQGVELFPSTVALIGTLRSEGILTALISSSRHLHPIVDATGSAELFDATVDGVEAEESGLPGKPDPAIFLEAARRLGVKPGRAVVVEDSLAGVEAGRRGGFLMVVGIDRTRRIDRTRQFREHGADVVVGDLDRVDASAGARSRPR
jgi:alpha,alpha-trehalase